MEPGYQSAKAKRAEAAKMKARLSRRALLARLTRALEAQGRKLHKASVTQRGELGDYFVTDGRTVVAHHVNLAELARELGVVEPWETLGRLRHQLFRLAVWWDAVRSPQGDAMTTELSDLLSNNPFLLAPLVIVLALVPLPSIFAQRRKHPQVAAILVLNLVAGWTVVGWMVALVWAFIVESDARLRPIL